MVTVTAPLQRPAQRMKSARTVAMSRSCWRASLSSSDGDSSSGRPRALPLNRQRANSTPGPVTTGENLSTPTLGRLLGHAEAVPGQGEMIPQALEASRERASPAAEAALSTTGTTA